LDGIGCTEDLANINVIAILIDLRVVMVEDGVVGTRGRRDGVARVAGYNGVGGQTVFFRGGSEAQDGPDGEIGAGSIELACIERGELEGGDVVLARNLVAVVAVFDSVSLGTVSSDDGTSTESNEGNYREKVCKHG